MGTITGSNAIIQLTVPGLFNVPQQLRGFAADDLFDSEQLDNVEVLQGVDGVLSFGFIYMPLKQNFTLQADSPSIAIFDAIYAAQIAAQEVYPLNAVILLTSVGKKWNLGPGALTKYKPFPDAKKLLQPQKFEITWSAPVGPVTT